MMKFNLYLIIISSFLFLGCSKSEKTEKANVRSIFVGNGLVIGNI